MRNFEYVKVKSIEEATQLLTEYGEKAHLLAGGTDILVKLKQRQIAPELLIDIKGILGLRGVEYEDGKGMKIGPLTTIREIERSSLIQAHLPVLAYAASLLGSVQVRHRATIGGNLCNALPSADTGPCLIGMGARVVAVSLHRKRSLLVEELFVGTGRNSLRSDELLSLIEIPAWPEYMGAAYIKHAVKRAVDVALLCVAAVVVTDPMKEFFKDARIVLGGVASVPIRPEGAEDYLRGRRVEDETIERAGELASEAARPRTSVEYKREMVKVLTRRVMRQALEGISKDRQRREGNEAADKAEGERRRG
jgi:carbon-monoxide dehydrogenase medium subunit